MTKITKKFINGLKLIMIDGHRHSLWPGDSLKKTILYFKDFLLKSERFTKKYSNSVNF